jgi:AmmeMemoRadiSam system protein B/AmmeMemoRadiSam system protein A
MTTCRRLLFLLLFLPVLACDARQQQVDRQAAVAGQFYPADPAELKRTVNDLFRDAVAPTGADDVAALIVPHAGYVYSGGVAASGLNRIDPHRVYDNVFIIGSSHRTAFDGASVYCSGDFLTPLGPVRVNRTIGEELAKTSEVFSTRRDAHLPEHSLEVQLPLLQTRLAQPLQIVPILVGTTRPETCRKIAAALRPFLNQRNLFVVSSDFSHYPAYDTAVRVDRETADAIISNSPDELMRTLQRHDEAGIPNLATGLCGWSSVLTLLYMTSPDREISYRAIQYRNSGDAPSGIRSGVVGYWAIIATRQDSHAETGFSLDAQDRAALLSIARRAVESCVTDHTVAGVDPAGLGPSLLKPCGAFVTITKHHALRGCIGRIETTDPLFEVVQQLAVASATQDRRFDPVLPSELRELEIEISVLSPLRKITSIDEIQLGRHGIYVRKGGRSGTLLPQVVTETGWTKEEFLGYCSRDKAGIGWDGWKDADLYVYEAFVFREEGGPAHP